MQDQDTRSRGVVQPRPGQLDLLQLAQGLAAEEFNRCLVAGFRPGPRRTGGRLAAR